MMRYRPPPRPTERMKRLARDFNAPLDIKPQQPKVDEFGQAKISHPDQIPETYCDISSKDLGECYMGLSSATVYRVVLPWELDDD